MGGGTMNKFIASGQGGWTDPINIVTIVLLLGLVAMMLYSMKRRKSARTQVEKMLDELRPGQRVRTVGGIIGRIKEIREETPATKTDKGVVIPAVKTVLIQTGSDKYPAYMLFDIQAIYGVMPEEGHTIEGLPIMKLPAPEEKANQPTAPEKTKQPTAAENINDLSELNAREYVDKRNALANKDKKKTK